MQNARQIGTPLFGEFSRSSRDLSRFDYDSHKSRDDRLNSPKSGMWIFLVFCARRAGFRPIWGGLKHKKGRISNDVGLRKTQEGKDFQAKLAEVEWPKTQEGEAKKNKFPDPAKTESLPAGQSPTNRACFLDDARSTRQTPSNNIKS